VTFVRRHHCVGQAAPIAAPIARVGNDTPRTGAERPPDRAMRLVAAHDERPVEPLPAQLPSQRNLPQQRQRMHASAAAHARIDPCAGKRRMIARDPRVVVVREQVNLRVRDERPGAVEHRPRQQQVAELVALDDEHPHAGRFDHERRLDMASRPKRLESAPRMRRSVSESPTSRASAAR